jgi:cyclophilin family peptidyl-prolyl cis-trans isomerase
MENESNNQNNLIIGAIVIILVLGLGIYFYKKNNTLPADQSALLNDLQKDQYNYGQNDSTASAPSEDQAPIEADKTDNSDNIKNMNKPEMQINTKKQYTATLKTSEGDIKIKLYADKTPITVNNFVYLAKQSFYNNTIFHRVIDGFMIQGGDPQGNGTGGPGYKFDDEKFDGEYKRGIIAMANAGPNTNGSQFFIMHKDNPLPKNYVIFGEVTEGLDVVDKIATAETTYGAMGERSKPVNPVKVTEAVIEEK